MLHDVVLPPDQPPMEQVSSPLSAQILEFCESQLFQETIQNSDSNCYEEQSSFARNMSFPHDMMNYATPTTTATTPATGTDQNGNHNNYATLFEEKTIENDISAPQGFATLSEYPFSHQDQLDLSLLQSQIQLATDGPVLQYPLPNDRTDIVSMMGAMGCEPDRLSMPPSKCMRVNNPSSSPNHCFLDHTFLQSNNSNPMLPISSCGVFNGNLSFANEIQAHELDFHGDDGGMFFPDPLRAPYNSNEIQALSNESQHLINNGGGSCNHPLAPPEITSLESESFRVASKLTTEERKEKIHRYMKKRNERNFSKKIKYACRKTLADSRPRVRGRFAKNDEFEEHHRNTCNTHEEDTDEDVKSMHMNMQVMVKEEEKMDSSDIFISFNDSFRCNSIPSWKFCMNS